MLQSPISLALFIVALCQHSVADTARVAVASNFHHTAKALAKAFAQQTGHQLTLVTASSGQHYAQILHGAPFDVLLSADQDKPRRLVAANLAEQQFTYAIGRLVAASSHRVEPLAALRGTVVIANPALAPYGQAATQVLRRFGKPARLLQGNDVGQALKIVVSGSVDAGLVALSQVEQLKQSQTTLHTHLIPAAWHQPIRQDAVLLRHGKNNRAARAFLAYLRSQIAHNIMTSHGYELAQPVAAQHEPR